MTTSQYEHSGPWFAHSQGHSGLNQTQREHLEEVEFGAVARFPNFLRADVRLAALFHDFGKYSNLFQRRLLGLERGLDHWTPGAYVLLKSGLSEIAAAAVHAHHVGLGAWSQVGSLSGPANYKSLEGSRLTLPDDADIKNAIVAMHGDGFNLAPGQPTTRIRGAVGSMLDTRMVLSALVHADYTDTARHMRGASSPLAIDLNAQGALDALTKHLALLGKDASPIVRQVRADLWEASLAAAEAEPGLFELEAPTGSGKTLAMLGFALRHMVKWKKKRLIVALPYLSILDQTVDAYREALGEHAVGLLEHHSLAEWRQPNEEDGDDSRRRIAEALSESWEAPIVVTTTVQLLESMFTAHPGTSRKLCSVAESVILLDEAQSLPRDLIVPTLKALARLAHPDYGASVVVATATQPLFSYFANGVAKESASVGWTPKQIASPSLNLYGRSQRYTIDWTRCNESQSWEGIAGEVAKLHRALVIVNTKRQARQLAELVLKREPESPVRHLSTNMCSAHRRSVLAEADVHNRQSRCLFISTQCVEAGVDLDFPVVYRALAPLDAIGQAAGRCNRAGVGQGQVRVFLPEDAVYPGKRYEQGAQQTMSQLRMEGMLDPQDPAIFERYFRLLYGLDGNPGTSQEMEQAINCIDFPEVAKLYRLIDRRDVVHVVVPYGHTPVVPFQVTGRWFRSVRPFTVDAVRSHADKSVWIGSSVPGADDWFVLQDDAAYHPIYGLCLDAEIPVC